MKQVAHKTKKTAFNHAMVELLRKHDMVSLQLANEMGMTLIQVFNTIHGSIGPTDEFFERLGETRYVTGMELEALKKATLLPYPTDEAAKAELHYIGDPLFVPPTGYKLIDSMDASIELKLGKAVISKAGRPYRYENGVLLYEEHNEWKVSSLNLANIMMARHLDFYVWEEN